jgi:transposase
MQQYSRDFRERALRQLDAGRPVGEVADLFGVHRTTLLRWRQRRAQGQLAPRSRPGRTPRIGPLQQPTLLAQVRAHPDATLGEHCVAWLGTTGVPVRESTMCRALRRMGWPLKKEPDRSGAR